MLYVYRIVPFMLYFFVAVGIWSHTVQGVLLPRQTVLKGSDAHVFDVDDVIPPNLFNQSSDMQGVYTEVLDAFLKDPLFSTVSSATLERKPSFAHPKISSSSDREKQESMRDAWRKQQKLLAEGVRIAATALESNPRVFLASSTTPIVTARSILGCTDQRMKLKELVVGSPRQVANLATLHELRRCAPDVRTHAVVSDIASYASQRWLSDSKYRGPIPPSPSNSPPKFEIVGIDWDEFSRAPRPAAVLRAAASLGTCVVVSLHDETEVTPIMHTVDPAWSILAKNDFHPVWSPPAWLAAQLQLFLGGSSASQVHLLRTNSFLDRLLIGCRTLSTSKKLHLPPVCPQNSLTTQTPLCHIPNPQTSIKPPYRPKSPPPPPPQCPTSHKGSPHGHWNVVHGPKEEEGERMKGEGQGRGMDAVAPVPWLQWVEEGGKKTPNWIEMLAVAEARLQQEYDREEAGCGRGGGGEEEEGKCEGVGSWWSKVGNCMSPCQFQALPPRSKHQQHALHQTNQLRHRSIVTIGDSLDRSSVGQLCSAVRLRGGWRSAMQMVSPRGKDPSDVRMWADTSRFRIPHSAHTTVCYLPALDFALIATFHFGVTEDTTRTTPMHLIRKGKRVLHLDEGLPTRLQRMVATQRIPKEIHAVVGKESRNLSPNRRCQCPGGEVAVCFEWEEMVSVCDSEEGRSGVVVDGGGGKKSLKRVEGVRVGEVMPPALVSVSGGLWDLVGIWESNMYEYTVGKDSKSWTGNAKMAFEQVLAMTKQQLDAHFLADWTRFLEVIARVVKEVGGGGLLVRIPPFPAVKNARKRNLPGQRKMEEVMGWERGVVEYGGFEEELLLAVRESMIVAATAPASPQTPRSYNSPFTKQSPFPAPCGAPMVVDMFEMTKQIFNAATSLDASGGDDVLRAQLQQWPHNTTRTSVVAGDGYHPPMQVLRPFCDVLVDFLAQEM